MLPCNQRKLWTRTITLTILFFLPCSMPAMTESIDTCGLLSYWHQNECIFFQALDAPHLAWGVELSSLPDSLEYVVLRIQAEVVDCGSPCSDFHFRRCIEDPVITFCEPSDLGCGVLVEDPVDECHVWVSEIHGPLGSGLGGYHDGDTVGAIGFIDRAHASTCAAPYLYQSEFYDCSDSTNAAQSATWGWLRAIFR